MAYFQEIFINRNDKYSRFSIWLLKNEGVVCPNARDVFSASGQKQVTIGGKRYSKVPRVLVNLFENIDDLVILIETIPIKELNKFWNKKTSQTTRLSNWIDYVASNAKILRGAKDLDVRRMLYSLIEKK